MSNAHKIDECYLHEGNNPTIQPAPLGRKTLDSW